jgi:CRP/FNR family transcriptional regulator, cyclic AMP receptor protein
MARMLPFKEGDVLIAEGEQDTAAYLIRKGWLQVHRARPGRAVSLIRLGPGDIVGELGLAGRVPRRTATVTALTDGEVEVIDRGTLIRLVNGPGNRLTPLLAALFSRLQSLLLDRNADDALDDTVVTYAKLEGLTPASAQALCNQPCTVTRLPWVFGSHASPQSVTDLFREDAPPDVVLADASKLIRSHHLAIEAADDGGLQLRLYHYGDFCEVDEVRVAYGKMPAVVQLPPGEHILAFGLPADPYRFSLRVMV